jgi:hypothetical protein
MQSHPEQSEESLPKEIDKILFYFSEVNINSFREIY